MKGLINSDLVEDLLGYLINITAQHSMIVCKDCQNSNLC